MTKEEKQQLAIAAKENHKTMSDYVRSVLAEPPDVTREEYEYLKRELVYQIRKIGVNVNQIAKKYNENRWDKPSKRLMDEMDKIHTLTNEVVNRLQ